MEQYSLIQPEDINMETGQCSSAEGDSLYFQILGVMKSV